MTIPHRLQNEHRKKLSAVPPDPWQMNIFGPFFRGSKRGVFIRAAAFIATIALIDWRVTGEVALGFLYLIPMTMIGSVAGPATIAAAAALCTFLSERFGDLPWTAQTGPSRVVLHFAAFVGAALFIREVNKSRRAAAENLHEIERERDARRDAEEQLRILIDSSPVAIVTADTSGAVLTANDAAHSMLGVAPGLLAGKPVHKYLPALANIAAHDASLEQLRAIMQARGVRDDGEAFFADICFSTYSTSAGLRLAAMVLDITEELRAHEVGGLHQLLEGSRLAVSALSHEMRNVCAAISAVHRNLKRNPSLAGSKDFEALESLLAALARIANINLHQSESQATEIDLGTILDELKIVVAPTLAEDGIVSDWTIEPNLPLVWADRSVLMQVFLNLFSNSSRALAKKMRRRLSILACHKDGRIVVCVSDNGGGVTHPEHLFRPFQAGAESTGLGLYLSRAFMRSFGGELRYTALSDGACFIVELLRAEEGVKESLWMKSAS